MGFTNVSRGILDFQMAYTNNRFRKFGENFCRGVWFRNVQEKRTPLT